MKLILYYIALLVFGILLISFLVSQHAATGMSMGQTVPASAALIIYVIILSLMGEGHPVDERETAHRYFSNRVSMLAGTIVLSLGAIYQLYNHHLDYWLVAGLISINIAKISSLIYLNYKR